MGTAAASHGAAPVLFVILWSSGFISAKLGVSHAEPFTFLLLRFLFVIALMLPLAMLWRVRWPRSPRDAGHIAVAGLLLHLPGVRPLLAPPSLRHEEAAKLARLQFAAIVQRRTAERIGVLLFVSLAEHHVEILVDRAIGERIPEQAWRTVIDGFTAQIREGRLADGFVEATERCADLLEKEFPLRPGDRDELPNRVTFI